MYAGQLDYYKRSNVILEKFIDAEVSATQIYLEIDYYGQAVKKEVNVCKSLEHVKKTKCYM